jgi:hypothetical protein
MGAEHGLQGGGIQRRRARHCHRISELTRSRACKINWIRLKGY